MANIRVKDLDTKASFASDDEILMDSPSGTGTMLRDAFIAAVASQIVAAPSTYKIATLDGADKLTSSQDPSQSVSYLGGHDMVANSPALADGSGTAGDTYYVTNPGTRNYGSGNITAQEGDALVYSGSVWQLVEGIANILDGISTASTARNAIEVNSIDEDAEATGTKLVGPALYFDGSNDYVEVADDAKLSFTDGTDDLPFSISGWINMSDATNFTVASKYSSANEWRFYVNSLDDLSLALTDGTNSAFVVTDTDLSGYEGQWIHVSCTYSGAGPNSGNAFTAAANGIILYINGVAVLITATNNASYAGMADTSDPVRLGRQAGVYTKGHIKDVKIFNRELTATEVAQLSKGNDLGFADEWGDHTTDTVTDGGFEAWNTASDLTSWTDGSAVSVAQESSDVLTGTYSLKLTGGGSIGVTGNNWLWQGGAILNNKRYRAIVTAKRFSGSTDSFQVGVRYTEFLRFDGTTFSVYNGATLLSQTALGSGWYKAVIEFTAPMGTASELVLGVNGVTDPYLVDSVEVYQIGTLADFRAENFIADKLIDQSSNNFVGTNNGATLVGGRKALQLDTDGAAAGNNVLSIYNGSSHLAYLTDKGDLNANSISSGASTELTIATGAVTATKSYHTIDTESDAASDDLDTISGGRAGQILVVQANNSARSVVLKDGTGNLKLSGDITLDNAEDTATLVSDGTSWYLIATSNNGA